MVDPAALSVCDHRDRGTGPGPAPAGGPRVALAHDWIVACRGGERVLAAIADALTEPPVRLYTMFHNGASISPAINACPTTVSPLNRAPGAARRWLLPAYPVAVGALSRRLAADHRRVPIDLLISTSSAAIKGLRPPPGVPHLCYCHTPARYLWSQTHAYLAGGAKGVLRGVGLGVFRSPLRAWDRRTASGVTMFLANSTHTREQIRLAWDRDAKILHPPVRTDFFTPDPAAAPEDFLLVVSALEPYKKVELAIDAAAAAGRPLIVIGAGSHEPALRAHARARAEVRVTFLGRADDHTVRDHLRRAHAFLMPQIEDFGITAVEAQACGTPVVALDRGGARDSVVDGGTGALVREPDAAAFAAAIGRVGPEMAAACRANAERFSDPHFRAGLLDAVREVLGDTTPG